MTAASTISLLAVEDVEEMRQLLEQVLSETQEIKMTSAKNGIEARLELYRRRPDIVLLDEVLPGESSLDLLNEFISQQVPVILMTSLEKPSPQLPPGALARIAKPGWNSLEKDRLRIKNAILNGLAQSQA
jgi:DNA-binding NtrC family response regulator